MPIKSKRSLNRKRKGRLDGMVSLPDGKEVGNQPVYEDFSIQKSPFRRANSSTFAQNLKNL